GTLDNLSQCQWQNVDFLPYKKCPADRLQKLYADASTIWVTEDSVSMIYEAMTSGAIVGLLTVPRKNKTRVSTAVDNLIQKHFVTAFNS
ncbi:MAG: hypothetical protein GTN53_46765, partial [Candidatus Aminicenantes bacterium]|nr:hypothetical protein [Candidatus Aminicenantes bacterium]NIQ73913.1 hypothetical protein [Candidatus Aminicenantes bacterium]NIT30014.1 hypothetical protein [Candidatus Aminicenantes bacterium]